MSWMAWTPVTAAFFAAIALILSAMTAWELASPSVPRRGMLPLVTTRGDRLFVGLVTSAWLHLAWVGTTDLPPWWATIACLPVVAALIRWG